MKRILILSVVAISAIIVSCSKSENTQTMHSATEHSTGTKSDEVLLAMHKPMMDVVFVSGVSYDVSFLENMIPHHKGAVDSSKLMLSYSTDDNIKTIANRIIEAQEKEIKEFMELIATLKKENKSYDKAKASEYDTKAKADMDKMMQNMSSIKITGNIDKDYLTSMIEHHKGAVSASKIVLEYTSDDRVKEIANRIIADQEKEIKEFQDMLAKLK